VSRRANRRGNLATEEKVKQKRYGMRTTQYDPLLLGPRAEKLLAAFFCIQSLYLGCNPIQVEGFSRSNSLLKHIIGNKNGFALQISKNVSQRLNRLRKKGNFEKSRFPQWLKPDSLQSSCVRPEGRTFQTKRSFPRHNAAGVCYVVKEGVHATP
jgi:hypothetical protein